MYVSIFVITSGSFDSTIVVNWSCLWNMSLGNMNDWKIIIKATVTTPTKYMPDPKAMPTMDVVHMPAAVVSPVTP